MCHKPEGGKTAPAKLAPNKCRSLLDPSFVFTSLMSVIIGTPPCLPLRKANMVKSGVMMPK